MGSLVKIGEYINSRIYSKERAFMRSFIFKSSKYYDTFFNFLQLKTQFLRSIISLLSYLTIYSYIYYSAKH